MAEPLLPLRDSSLQSSLSPENAKASPALVGLAFEWICRPNFRRRSDMQQPYLYIRRFLQLVKVILVIFWLVLKIAEALK